MRRSTVKLPRVGETVDEVVILEWVAGIGSKVAAGDVLLRVETDKAAVEIPAPVAGTVVEHLVAQDDEVATGALLAVLEHD